MPEAISAFILAGGVSRRMGVDKALLTIDGVPMIQRSVQLLESLNLSPVIIGSRPDLAHFAPVIPDLREHCGPLSGIEAGLLAAGSAAALFIPVDIPLMTTALLRILLARYAVTGSVATIPRILGQPQPISAIYHRDLLPAIAVALTAGNYKVLSAIQQGAASLSRGLNHLPGHGIDIFDVETLRAAAGCHSSLANTAEAFLNCNTPADFSRARQHIRLHPVQ